MHSSLFHMHDLLCSSVLKYLSKKYGNLPFSKLAAHTKTFSKQFHTFSMNDLYARLLYPHGYLWHILLTHIV